MTPLLLLTIGLAGGLGAVCRFILDGIIQSFADRKEFIRSATSSSASSYSATSKSTFPWSTVTINITGSFLVGLVVGSTFELSAGEIAPALSLPAGWSLVAGTGFLGGYTTFSTASVDAIRLARAGRWAAAVASAFGVLIAGTAAAGLGMWWGGLAA